MIHWNLVQSSLWSIKSEYPANAFGSQVWNNILHTLWTWESAAKSSRKLEAFLDARLQPHAASRRECNRKPNQHIVNSASLRPMFANNKSSRCSSNVTLILIPWFKMQSGVAFFAWCIFFVLVLWPAKKKRILWSHLVKGVFSVNSPKLLSADQKVLIQNPIVICMLLELTNHTAID